MQEVYKDGTGGGIADFTDHSTLMDCLEKATVDRVEVFKQGSEAHKRAVNRIADPEERKKARRKLRKIVAKKK